MAKRKKEGEEVAEKTDKKVAFTGHHRRLNEQGEMRIHVSRPSGKPWVVEEWITPTKAFVIRKVMDSGRVITYVESSVEDATGQ